MGSLDGSTGTATIALLETADLCLIGFNLIGVPEPETNPVSKNRYASFRSDENEPSAIRVELVDLPPPHDVLNGQIRWVAEPAATSENAGVTDPADAPGEATFMAASLSCEPFVADWSTYGDVHIVGEEIVPDGTYRLSEIPQDCLGAFCPDHDLSLLPVLEITTSAWGDVSDGCAGGVCAPPDGAVDITTDVTGILDKFRNLEGTLPKARADIEPASGDLLVNISDVSACLDAFRNEPFPFAPPASGCP